MDPVKERDAAIALAAKRKLKIRFCKVCGGRFTTVGRGEYCEPKCRQKAGRERLRMKARVRVALVQVRAVREALENPPFSVRWSLDTAIRNLEKLEIGMRCSR